MRGWFKDIEKLKQGPPSLRLISGIGVVDVDCQGVHPPTTIDDLPCDYVFRGQRTHSGERFLTTGTIPQSLTAGDYIPARAHRLL